MKSFTKQDNTVIPYEAPQQSCIEPYPALLSSAVESLLSSDGTWMLRADRCTLQAVSLWLLASKSTK